MEIISNYSVTRVRLDDKILGFAINNKWSWQYKRLQDFAYRIKSINSVVDVNANGAFTYAIADFRRDILKLDDYPGRKEIGMIVKYEYARGICLVFEDIPVPMFLDESKKIKLWEASDIGNRLDIKFPFEECFVTDNKDLPLIIAPSMEEIKKCLNLK